MCEILALNACCATQANRPLDEFFADSPHHPHGWGLAWSRQNDGLWLDKEPLPAHRSEYLRCLLDTPIQTTWLVAHIRNATRGVVTYENCHPFRKVDAVGTTWIFAHNGTMLSERGIAAQAAEQRGTTDSERVLLRLLSALNDARALSGGTMSFNTTFSTLARVVAMLAPHNKLNIVMGDGTYTYAHTNTIQPTLWHSCGHGVAAICTRPLEYGTRWQPIPRGRLVAYRNGTVVAISAPHDALFDNDRYMRILEDERKVLSGL